MSAYTTAAAADCLSVSMIFRSFHNQLLRIYCKKSSMRLMKRVQTNFVYLYVVPFPIYIYIYWSHVPLYYSLFHYSHTTAACLLAKSIYILFRSIVLFNWLIKMCRQTLICPSFQFNNKHCSFLSFFRRWVHLVAHSIYI